MHWPFFFSRRPGTPRFAQTYGGLSDSTGPLLAVSTNQPALTLLQECIPDTLYVPVVNYPNYPDPFFLATTSAGSHPELTWNRVSRRLVKTRPGLLTSAIRDKSRLATSKLGAITTIMQNLSRARYKYAKGVILQETVYLTKKIQAQRFRDSGYDEDRLAEYPYVIQYADVANLSLQQAADDILFKAKLSDDGLAKTEFLRLKYLNLVRAAKEAEEIQAIVKQFTRDCFSSQLT